MGKGNPLVYVNHMFEESTGYTAAEVLGRNCRFLQGPGTEPESIGVIQKALQTAGTCVVKLTNYKRSGQTFEMLIGLRVQKDLSGVPRYCIGVQYEVTSPGFLKAIAPKLSKLMKLLPSEIPSAGH